MAVALRVARSIDRVTESIGRVMLWLSLAMVLIGAFNVLARYLGPSVGLHLSGNVYLELQTYLYALVFLLGAPYALRHGAHVRVDIWYASRRPRTRAWIDILGFLFLLLPFCLLGLWFSWSYVASSWATLEGSPNAGGLPRYPIKTAILASFALLIVQGASETIKNAARLRGHDVDGDGESEGPTGARTALPGRDDGGGGS